jgi:hypothetical protein
MSYKDRMKRKELKKIGDARKATTNVKTRAAALKELGGNILGRYSDAQSRPALLRAHRAYKAGKLEETTMNDENTELKDFFKNRINEALKGDRQKLTFMGKARGIDPNTFLPTADPRNLALMRDAYTKVVDKGVVNAVRARGAALSRAADTLMRTEFQGKRGGTDPVYEAVLKKLAKKKGKSGGTDATY